MKKDTHLFDNLLFKRDSNFALSILTNIKKYKINHLKMFMIIIFLKTNLFFFYITRTNLFYYNLTYNITTCDICYILVV